MSQDLISWTVLGGQSPNITYNGVWTVLHYNDSTGNLYNRTDTYSGQMGATAMLHFYGTSVDYWSNQNAQHGPCGLTLDNANAGTVTSFLSVNGDPKILYTADNLELKDHTLVIQVLTSTVNANRCEIDRFVVNVTAPAVPVGSSSPSPGSTSKSSSTGAIVGGILGGIALLSIAFFLIWWYRRSSRKKKVDYADKIAPFGVNQPTTSEIERSTVSTAPIPAPDPVPSQYTGYSIQPPSTHPPSALPTPTQTSSQRPLTKETFSGNSGTPSWREGGNVSDYSSQPPPAYMG